MAAVEQDVLGLDVAVDDLVPVGVVERVGHFAGDAEGVVERQLRFPPQPLAQGAALHVRHGEPELAVGGAGVVHGQDVGVLHPGAEPDLAQEPVGAERLRQLAVKHLERDRSVVSQVMRQKHRGHPAASQLTLDAVAVGQGGLQTGERVGQGGSGGE